MSFIWQSCEEYFDRGEPIRALEGRAASAQGSKLGFKYSDLAVNWAHKWRKTRPPSPLGKCGDPVERGVLARLGQSEKSRSIFRSSITWSSSWPIMVRAYSSR